MDSEDRTEKFKLYPKRSGDQRYVISLLVFHRDGARVVPLSPGKGITIGRGPPVDVLIHDNTLSQQHARFELDGNTVIVQDLNSTNGVWMDGQRDARFVLKPGDEVKLGRITVSVHLLGANEGPMHRMSSHDQFVSALEEEISRAKTFGVALAVLHVQALDARVTITRCLPWIRTLLRPSDHYALYSSSAVEIFLPEAGIAKAKRMARKILKKTVLEEQADPQLRIGISTYPDSSTSAGGLIHTSRMAAYSSTEQHRIRVADLKRVQAWSDGKLKGSALSSSSIVVGSPVMEELYAAVDRLSQTDIPVLLQGETGTGKEVVARVIHERGARKDCALCCINCAAIPGQLVESIFFGHVRGAFTGADTDAIGVFEEASGGTVLLDEISELSLSAQAKLLRVIETKQICRVGSPRERTVDVRIIAATHMNLEEMCETAQFRWDLLYRINTMTLKIPPLRERIEEIPLLIDLFIQQANQINNSKVLAIEDEALHLLQSYSWPGNVRELRNAIERAVVLARCERITVEDLPDRVRFHRAEDNLDDLNVQRAASEIDEASGSNAESSGGEHRADPQDLRTQVKQFEAQLIQRTLKEANGNQREAARRLRIPLRTLVRRISDYGLGEKKTDPE